MVEARAINKPKIRISLKRIEKRFFTFPEVVTAPLSDPLLLWGGGGGYYNFLNNFFKQPFLFKLTEKIG